MEQKPLYREVSRKANVGERIKIVNPRCAIGYGKDDEGVVKTSLEYGVNADINGRPNRAIWHEEYVVLEPIAQQTPAPPQQLDFLEAIALFMRENAAAVRKYLDEIAPEKAPVTQSKPLTRAEVIAKAKADVAELKRIGRTLNADLPKGTPFYDRFYRTEFHVNREKRAVTALVRKGRSIGRKPDAKATAKAAPGDVFHAEIGKAIALRKALGLPVPDEYINAPKPDEPRVGAVALWTTSKYGPKRTTFTKRVPDCDGSHYGNYAFLHTAECGWIADKQYVVIDDTDVDYDSTAEGSAA